MMLVHTFWTKRGKKTQINKQKCNSRAYNEGEKESERSITKGRKKNHLRDGETDSFVSFRPMSMDHEVLHYGAAVTLVIIITSGLWSTSQCNSGCFGERFVYTLIVLCTTFKVT